MIEFLQDALPIIIFALVLSVLWFALRTRTSRMESAEEVDRQLAGGQPVVMKFFKNT